MLVTFHDVEADIGSFGQRIDIFLVFDGVYLFVPLESLVFSLCEFVAIWLFLSCYVPVAKTFGGSLLLCLLDRYLGLGLHILFVKIITLRLITSLEILKSRVFGLMLGCYFFSRRI
jgi:hypothetical protein